MNSTKTINTETCVDWGIAARGVALVIDGPFMPSISDPWIIDVENNPDGSCAGVGITNGNGTILFFTPAAVAQWDRDMFKDIQLVGHNIKYDVQMLRKWGFNVTSDQVIWDTQIAEYVRDSTRVSFGLKQLVSAYFESAYPSFEDLTGKGTKAVPIGTLPIDIVANYNGCDVLFTYKLYTKQLVEMTHEQQRYMTDIELPCMRVLLEMEERGIQIDANYLRSLDIRLAGELEHVADGIRRVAELPLNLNSHVQIKQLLLDKAGLSLKSTAAEELCKYEKVPLVKDLLRYRGFSKLRSTYTLPLIKKAGEQTTYRLNARFNQTVTHTARLSSSEPNLQNIPTRTAEGNEIRQAFIAKPGHVLVDGDFSQIEPRLMAHFSQDPELLRIFRDDEDLYESVARVVGLDPVEGRPIAKTLWLAMSYNAGAYKISQKAGITRTQAEVFLTRMKLTFQKFFYWRSKTIAHAELKGGVSTMFGRFIPLSQENAHLAPNYMIQGTAAELMKLVLSECRGMFPVSTVHDELILEVPEKDVETYKAKLADKMAHVVMLSVPIVAEVGAGINWAEAKG